MDWEWLQIMKTISGESTTTPKRGGLILTLKGSAVFTAEPQRTLKEMFFSFPLRGRKAKILSPTGHDGTLVGDRYLPMMLVHHSNAECFSFAVLSTAKEKSSHSASFASLAKRAVRNILSLTRIAKLGPST